MYGNPYSQPCQPWNQWQSQQPYTPQPQPQYQPYQPQGNMPVTRQEFEELRSGYDRLAQQLAAIQYAGGNVDLPQQGYSGSAAAPPTSGSGWQDNPNAARPGTQPSYTQPAQPPVA